jgi:RNA polymerase subunit RPABC4/transcription elongation factor Spt4
MKYCYKCAHVTQGKPLFCQSCGSSYGVKLCPRLHVNPRYAEVCSQCGTRDLSTPQPKVSTWWKALELCIRIVSGILLVALSLLLLVACLKSSVVQAGLVGLGLLLLTLWALWILLPEWFRKLVHHALKRKEHHRER